MKPIDHTVLDPKGLKLGDYLIRHVPFLASKASVKKALSRGDIKLNGEAPGYFTEINEGDNIRITREQRRAPKPAVDSGDIPIVFQDEHMVVVDKPGGIAVNGNRHKTVENVIQHVVGPSSVSDALPYARPVHRLDVPTAGLVILARSRAFQIGIGQALEDKKITKKYIAVVHGHLTGEGEINKPLEGKPCTSKFRVIRSVPSVNFGRLTMIELEPVTGRTHQLRKHMQMIGHPIAGDKMYNRKEYVLQNKGMLLASVYLSFQHPVTGQPVEISIKAPRKFERVLDREERFFDKKFKGKKD